MLSRYFEIQKYYTSKRGGNSSYIDFFPVSEDGTVYDSVLIKFRVSDHESKTIGRGKKPKVARIVSFVIKDITYENSIEFILDIDHLCEELQHGNFSTLDDYT